MENRAYLNTFLKFLKEELNFKFNLKKFNERLALQKYVYIAKFFGWEHSYTYKIYLRGTYSSPLADDYYNLNTDLYGFAELGNFDKQRFKSFVKDHDVYWLEATALMNYLFRHHDNVEKNECVDHISEKKPYISRSTIEDAYEHSINLGLLKHQLDENSIELSETEKNLEETGNLKVMSDFIELKINKLMDFFDDLPVTRNSVFILGSLDYFSIVLEKENVDNSIKMDLFNFINKYLIKIENIYNLIRSDHTLLEGMDLEDLEYNFDFLQDYVSQELDIIPRLDSDEMDELLIY